MKKQYSLKELIPLETLNELLDFFTALTGVAGVVMDLQGNYISNRSRYTRYCKDFIQATQEGKKACKEFAKKLGHQAIKNPDGAYDWCPFLLYDCKIPIMVEDDAVGFLGLGQILLDEPQLEKHQHIASKLGLDPEAFLEALGEVPRMGLEDFRGKARLFGSLASLISYQGMERLRTEKELKQGIDRAETLYHHLPMGVNLLSPELDLIRINRFVEERLGVRAEEIMGKKCYLVAGQYRDDPSRQGKEKICDNCPTVAALKTGSPQKLVRKVKEDYIVECTAVPIRDEQGRITEIMEIVQDVTGDVRSKEEIARSRDYLNAVINHMFDGLMVLERDLRIVDVNDRFLSVYGGSREEVLGRPCYEITHRLDRPCHALGRPCPAREVFETGQPVRREMTHINSLGEEAYMEVGAAPLFNAAGEVERVVEVARDVTKRKRAEEALRASEERYSTIFYEARDGIVLTDKETGRIEDCNPQFEELAGRSLRDLKQMKIWEIRPPEKVEKARKTFYELREKGVGGSEDLEFQRPDGTIVPIEFVAKKVSFRNKQLIQTIARDITERKQAEKEREKLEEQLRHAQKMEAVGALAGGVAHDFNNLLTTIIGNAQLALSDLRKEDPLYEDITEIKKAGEKAADLTRKLLMFSRKETRQPEILDLNESLRETGKMLRRLIREDIDLVMESEPGLWKVHMDPTQVDQVIMNLVVNARDAMPKGGILTIETANVELDRAYFRKHAIDNEPGSYVMLAVTDTGIGMDESVRARMFDPFFTTKERGTGTGLGLATVYGIVRQNGGYIWSYSEPGQGTTIKVYLPRVEDVLEPGHREDAHLKELTGSETVLVLEDNDLVRNMALKVLERYGYHTLEARDGEEAIRVSRDFDGVIHLLLTDVIMPGMSGKEVSEKLQAERPAMQTLYMSGYTQNIIMQKGILTSDIHYIQKPFTPKALARVVRETIES
jgi:PAS domain S-box-containing protein